MAENEIILKDVFTVENPAPMLLYALIIGLNLGFSLDLFSFKERIWGKNSVITFFTDFISVLFSYLLLFLCSLNLNCGIIRWYHVFSLVLGVYFYKKIFSKYVLLIFDKTFLFFIKIIRFAKKILIYPFKKCVSLLRIVYNKIYSFSSRKYFELVYKSALKKQLELASSAFNLVK